MTFRQRRTAPPPAPSPNGASVWDGYWAGSLGRLAARALQLLLVLAVVAVAIWGIRQVTLVTIPLILALILASALTPAMTFMRRHRVPDLLAAVLLLLGAAVVLGGITGLIVSAISDQWDELYARATEGFTALLSWAATLPFAPANGQFQEWGDSLLEFVRSQQFSSGAVAGVGAVANLLAGTVLTLTILFFLLKDGPRMWEFLLRPFRGEREARALRIGDKSITVLGSYVRGIAAVALIDAIGIGVGLLVLDVPLALPLAVLVFLLAFVPILGAVLAGVIAALVAFVANGWASALAVVALVVAVNQIEGNFLQPVLMGRSMRLHSLVVLIAITAGTAVGGILGAILAVPLTAVAWGIVQVWDGPALPAAWARPRTP